MRKRLFEIARELNFSDLEGYITKIPSNFTTEDIPLILPFVGEFSAGKTTLINALSDSKALECAPDPTTATIYIVHFGAGSTKADIHFLDGSKKSLTDIAELNNKELVDAVVVDVFDTSTTVPPSILLVDTPGLSSHDVKHRQNLVEFLPQADGVFLVVDVNQPITRSLTDFARTIELSHRPLYMVLTQCDLKSPTEVESQRKYIKNNTDLHIADIACVSAKSGYIKELIDFFGKIQTDKSAILKIVNEHRCKEIASEMLRRIEKLLNADEEDDGIEKEIRQQKLELNKLHHEIEDAISDVSSEIEAAGREVCRRFEDEVFNRLESIVSGKSDDFDSEAISAINNASVVFMNDYNGKVRTILSRRTAKFSELNNIDLGKHAISGISYNINLNEAGHQYDSTIGNIVKGVAVVGAVVATAGVASGAIGGTVAAGETVAAGTAVAGEATAVTVTRGALMAADIADTVTDVASIVSNRKMQKHIDTVVRYGGAISSNLDKVNQFDTETGARLGKKKGIIQSMVGFVTEKTMGRPQRKRAISQYIDSTLTPQFKSELNRISNEVKSEVSQSIMETSMGTLNAVTTSLEEMQRQRKSQADAYAQKIKNLRTIKKELQQYE